MKRNPEIIRAFAKKLDFKTAYGGAYLTAGELAEHLKISKGHAYRIIKSQRLTQVQQMILEAKLFNAIQGCPGWTSEDGRIISPEGKEISMKELETYFYWRENYRNSQRAAVN